MKNKSLLVVLLPLIFISGCTESTSETGYQDSAMPVEYVYPVEKTVTLWDEFTGRFEASQTSNVTPRVSGYIEEILFKDGDEVKQGQPLYKLDQRTFDIALSSAQANLTLAEKELERTQNLRNSNALSQNELDTKISELQQAQAAYDQAKLNKEFSTVTAPIAGRIDRTYVDEGNLIAGGSGSNTILTTIVAISPIYFYFNASERDVLTYVRRNMKSPDTAGSENQWPIQVKLVDEESFSHEGFIDFVSNTVSQTTGTLEIRAELANENKFLQPGFFGRLRIAPEGSTNKLTISPELIISQGSKKMVFVVGENNLVEPRFVELGPITDDGFQVITSGLATTDKIIKSNLQMLMPGVPVEPINADTTAGE